MEQRSYKIYKISNTINDKVYIGQTVNSLLNRFNQHCKTKTSKLGKDINKLGKDKFKIELLNNSATSIKELGELENKYITQYDSINKGYNSLKGCRTSANLNKALKRTFVLTIDEEVLIELKQFANKEDRTISSQINKILKDYLKGKE